MTSPYRIIAVCTGNICRSPMAELMIKQALQQHFSESAVELDSAGTTSGEQGNPIDPRAASVLRRHGISESGQHRARKIRTEDLQRNDLVLALDTDHAAWLRRQCSPQDSSKIHLLREFDPQAAPDEWGIADPWYGELADFEQCYQLIAAALPGIVEQVRCSVAGHV
ncbi:low molecular weight protein-tyrosine-phosphatase [Psychromicrobium sp. YIM B11713]|uniref:low molecular weight protein-tyrosine-phosphatase n=1 Tax=Psychromicrobium sp. YIM B11713 TaxID=3145233 RepID=UPI00374E6AE0